MMTTSYGLKFDTLPASEIKRFSGYDRTVASCHVSNCGKIIVYAEKNGLGEYEPIDNEYDLAEIYNQLDNN